MRQHSRYDSWIGQTHPGAAIRGRGYFNPSQMPLEQKLAIGTLKLEGTPQAVTATEATTLLPLWQQVKSLSADPSTAPADITAVYKQIEGAMTSDQTQAIQNMTWTQQDIQGLMTQYGVQFGNGQFGNGQGGPTLTADQRATRTAQFQSRNSNGGSGTYTPRTPQPGQGSRRGGIGMNSMFIDPVIKLLQTRAAGQ